MGVAMQELVALLFILLLFVFTFLCPVLPQQRYHLANVLVTA